MSPLPLINMSINLFFVLCGLISFSSNSNSIIYYKNYSCIIIILYFIIDSIKEILLYKRLEYIPHHILGAFLFYNGYKSVNDIKNLKVFAIMVSFIEFTSALLNLKIYLKNKKLINFKIDCILFLIYSLIRIILFPYIIYYYFSDISFRSCFILILFMSIDWMYVWYKNLLKY